MLPQAPFFSKIRTVVRFYKIFCRNKAKEYRAHKDLVRQQLHEATMELQGSLHDSARQER
jgi:hypothetical protein